MCVHVCACVFTCVHVFMCVHVCACVHVCVHVWACVGMCVHVCMCVYMCSCVYIVGGHKNTLRKYQPTLVELISLPDLLPHLNHHNVVTEEENRLLLDLSPMVPKERVLKLISILSDKSGMVYAAFLQALEDEKDHLGHRQLLNILKAAGGERWCGAAGC